MATWNGAGYFNVCIPFSEVFLGSYRAFAGIQRWAKWESQVNDLGSIGLDDGMLLLSGFVGSREKDPNIRRHLYVGGNFLANP